MAAGAVLALFLGARHWLVEDPPACHIDVVQQRTDVMSIER
jgi:hypothetical protein